MRLVHWSILSKSSASEAVSFALRWWWCTFASGGVFTNVEFIEHTEHSRVPSKREPAATVMPKIDSTTFSGWRLLVECMLYHQVEFLSFPTWKLTHIDAINDAIGSLANNENLQWEAQLYMCTWVWRCGETIMEIWVVWYQVNKSCDRFIVHRRSLKAEQEHNLSCEQQGCSSKLHVMVKCSCLLSDEFDRSVRNSKIVKSSYLSRASMLIYWKNTAWASFQRPWSGQIFYDAS